MHWYYWRGQLGKMIVQEAKRMSMKVIVLDPEEKSPASFLADEQIVADFRDEIAIRDLANRWIYLPTRSGSQILLS